MDLKFSVTEKTLKNDHSQALVDCQHGVCEVSIENLVIFTRVLYHNNSFKHRIPVYTVYIADLNVPYESHVILESLEQITSATFSSDGHQLLIVSGLGVVRYYMKGTSLHQWTNSHTSTWTGEDILHVDFFHSANKPNINVTDIKVNTQYSDKFSCRPQKPSLLCVGNCAQNGFFGITSSGILIACTLSSNGVLEEETRAVLGPVRDNYFLASAAFSATGSVHIAAWKPDLVKCWTVELSFTDLEKQPILESNPPEGKPRLKVEVQAAHSFSPSATAGRQSTQSSKSDHVKQLKVTHLQFCDKEDPTSLILFLEVEKEKPSASREKDTSQSTTPTKLESSAHSYILQKYKLQEKNRTFLKLFQQISNESSKTSATVKDWGWVAEWICPSPLVSILTCPHRLCHTHSIPSAIGLATTDSTLYSINKDSMQQLSKHNFAPRSEESSRGSPSVISLCSTWTGLHMIVLDSSGGLHLMALLRQPDMGTNWALYLMLLYEYSIVSDCDWFDILLATPPNSALTLADRLQETLNLHPAPLVQQLLTRFLVMRNSILRLSANLHQRSIESRLQAQLTAILRVCRTSRPVTSDVATWDKNVHSTIQTFIEGRGSLEIQDLDKSVEQLLFTCNLLDCQVDLQMGQDLQALLQFTTDLGLYLVLLLAQNPKNESSKDPKTLQYIREILFTCRLWYRHNKLVYPQIVKKSDQVDVWASLYKLITKLAQMLPTEPDPAFVDDCLALETQIVCREVPLFIPPRGILGLVAASTSGSQLPYPIHLNYFQGEPASSTSSVNPRPLEGCLLAPKPMDPLNCHYLGTNSALLYCTRCFAMRNPCNGDSTNGDQSQMSMWDQLWASSCPCSGHWASTVTHHASKAA